MFAQPTVESIVVFAAEPSDIKKVLVRIVMGFAFKFPADLARLTLKLPALNKMIYVSPSHQLMPVSFFRVVRPLAALFLDPLFSFSIGALTTIAATCFLWPLVALRTKMRLFGLLPRSFHWSTACDAIASSTVRMILSVRFYTTL